MGMEPASGAGASVRANSTAHDRVCSCHPAGKLAGCFIRSRIWVWPAHHSHPPRETGRFSGQDFPLQPDGTAERPAGQSLSAQERRREADGSLRVVYGAAFAVAALVRCVSSVNGRAAPPRSHARSAYCCIHWPSGMRRFSGETGAGESIDVPVCSLCVINKLR
jgi:hypothetical protein